MLNCVCFFSILKVTSQEYFFIMSVLFSAPECPILLQIWNHNKTSGTEQTCILLSLASCQLKGTASQYLHLVLCIFRFPCQIRGCKQNGLVFFLIVIPLLKGKFFLQKQAEPQLHVITHSKNHTGATTAFWQSQCIHNTFKDWIICCSTGPVWTPIPLHDFS